MVKSLPLFKEEAVKWKNNQFVIGVDEVGRGAFAGPLVAGAVAFYPNQTLPSSIIINDSKKLTPIQRETASNWIRKNVFSWGIGEVSVSYINKFGIVKATHKAFRAAIKSILTKQPYTSKPFVLVDAFHVPYLSGVGKSSQKAIIKGDLYCISIAAASIIAKVYRDTLMQKLSKSISVYDWEHNKGYGTKRHRDAILKNGVSAYHRFAFIDNLV